MTEKPKTRRMMSIEFVRYYFIYHGYKLLEKKYLGSKIKMKCICSKGHICFIRWNDFQQGIRCRICVGKPSIDIDYINIYISKKYKAICVSKKYRGRNVQLDFVCKCGNTFKTTWDNIIRKPKEICSNCFKGANWKGGVTRLNLPLHKTYISKLGLYQNIHKVERVIKGALVELLGVECHYCGKIFVAARSQVKHRIEAINGKIGGEQNLYCSEKCKADCSTHGQISYPKSFKNYKNKRPLQGQWAKLVKERDNNTCQICGAKEDTMIAHHIDPVVNNPIESADLDNGITLCKACDKKVHQLPWCTLSYLRSCGIKKNGSKNINIRR